MSFQTRIEYESTLTKFSPSINALRAIAVLAVIINHFYREIMPSGYLGVDMFFVISGFVITASIVSRKENNLKNFFLGFYKRRIKRLMPALLFFVFITILLISFFNPYPTDVITTGVFSIFGFSNINLYLNSIDYWGSSAKLNPFTHTWSLGVEEQFYLIYPLLLWYVIRGIWKSTQIARLNNTLLVFSFLSFFAFVFVSEKYQIATYFLSPFRFWEIGFGAVIFLSLKLYSQNIVKIFQKLPLNILLILSLFTFFIPLKYSVAATFLIVLLTVLMIGKIKVDDTMSKTSNRILTHKVLLYIGTISYSLYLWHWVVLVIAIWTIGVSIWTFPFLLMLILILSMFSYHFIENPFRKASWRESFKKKLFLISISIGLILIAVLQLLITTKNYFYLGDAPTENVLLKAQINNQLDCKPDREKHTILSLGNSHSQHILPMVQKIADQCNFDIVSYKYPDNVVIPSGNNRDLDKIEEELSPLKKGDILILSSRNLYLYEIPFLNLNGNYWYDKSKEKKDKKFGLSNWLRELDIVLKKAQEIGVKVIFFLPNVEFDKKVLLPKMCKKEWFRFDTLPEGCNPKVSKAFLDSRFPREFYLQVNKRAEYYSNFFIFDPLPIYCSNSNHCQRIVDNIIAFRDTNHLTPEGSLLMLDAFSLFLLENQILDDDVK